jgi:hypothetical protein
MRSIGQILNDRRERSGKHAEVVDYAARRDAARERMRGERNVVDGGAPKPPLRLPGQGGISLDGDRLVAKQGFATLTVTACNATIAVIDETGSRLTVTRALTIGLFALGARKKTGHVALVVGDVTTGASIVVKYKSGIVARQALEWAARFEAWNASTASSAS